MGCSTGKNIVYCNFTLAPPVWYGRKKIYQGGPGAHGLELKRNDDPLNQRKKGSTDILLQEDHRETPQSGKVEKLCLVSFF